jgi:hypothetical protein
MPGTPRASTRRPASTRRYRRCSPAAPCRWGAGAFAAVSEVEPYRHLVAQETYVLRPLPGDKTRLLARYRGAGFVSAAHAIRPDAGQLPRLIRSAILHLPGAGLALRGFDIFVSDPLHHYVETGMLNGIKARAEEKYAHASTADTAATLEPVATTI